MAPAYNVLVVDDEPALREICQEALSDAGYHVDVATDGHDALNKLGSSGYDLVISDLRMPGMPGQVLLHHIRQRRLDVDFLVMTGYGTTETAVDIMKNGAADYLTKPFDIKHMLLRVHSILEQRKTRKDQEKLSAVVRMLNLSKGLNAQLNHVAVVDEFLAQLQENFTPAAVCLLLPELLHKESSLVQGPLLERNALLRNFLVALSGKAMQYGRSYHLDQFSLKQHSFNTALFPEGFPYSVLSVPLELPHKRIGVISLIRDADSELYTEQDLQLLVVFASHTASALQNAHLYSRMRSMNQDVIRSFAQAVEVKDLYTRGHSERVASYACRLGRALELDAKSLEQLHIAGMLHDIGKIGIPDHILNKPGSLTDDEYTVMKRHSFLGREILGQVGALNDVAKIIYHHHERYDGRGYPDGLTGDETPYLSRVIGLVDSYEAMTSSRSYRQALPMGTVVDILDKGAGQQWDKGLTHLWLSIVEREQHGYACQ